jgi:hypothetical protein
VPRDRTPSDELAYVVASCAVRLPLQFSGAESERALRSTTPESWGQSSLIYRLPVIVIGEDGEGTINDRTIRYTPQRGLEVLRS